MPKLNRISAGLFLLATALLPAPPLPAQDIPRDIATDPGLAAYNRYCASCHERPVEMKAPALDTLRQMSPRSIAYALTNGKMRVQAGTMSGDEIDAVVTFLAATTAVDDGWITANYCPADRMTVDTELPATVNGFGLDMRHYRSMTAQQSGLSKSDMAGLQLQWVMAFPQNASMRTQPVIIGNTMFLAIVDTGQVFALDIGGTPCVKWIYNHIVPLRTSPHAGEIDGRTVLVFGDGSAHVQMIDALSGNLLWRSGVRVSSVTNTTGMPVLYGGRVYVPISTGELMMGAEPTYECCTSHGAVVALDARNGERLWVHHTMADPVVQGKNRVGTPRWGPSGAPIWTTPAIDEKRGVLYVGTGENNSEPATDTSDAVLAIDLDDGSLHWKFQATANDIFLFGCLFEPDGPNCPPEYSVNADWDFGASMIIAERPDGKDVILAGQKSGELWALDPDDGGRLLWRTDVGPGGPAGGIHWGMAYDGRYVFAAVNQVGVTGEDPDREPGLHAVDVMNGEVRWSYLNHADCSGDRKSRIPSCDQNYGLSAATLLVDGAVVQGGNDGFIRIFDGNDGQLLFSYDTARSYQGVNGVNGKGGSVDNTSVAAANGMLFVQSGYATGGAGGNVLLAFKPSR